MIGTSLHACSCAPPAAGLPTRRALLLGAGTALATAAAGLAVAAPASAVDGDRTPDGWPVGPDPVALGVERLTVPGTDVVLPVLGGPVGVVLVEVARRFHEEVEALDPSCWGFAYRANTNDPDVWSNHAAGIAIDLNSDRHPNGATGTFSDRQVDAVHEILDDLRGVVRWGGDYRGGVVDAMHFEIHVHPRSRRLRSVARRITDPDG